MFAVLVVAGYSRLISLIVVGTPHPLFLVLMIIEPALPVVVVAWQAAIAAEPTEPVRARSTELWSGSGGGLPRVREGNKHAGGTCPWSSPSARRPGGGDKASTVDVLGHRITWSTAGVWDVAPTADTGGPAG